MFCAVQKPYLLILANLQSNKRKKRYDFPIDFSIPTKNLESFSHLLAILISHLVWRAKNVGLFGQVTD